ncbi:MAG TPA: acyl-CoA dehydrogenase family protein [Acetobacteraceae bacterium]|nr:acyl-CoA dehydrogenase family protein [Acetobacteraceae bacterium]
MILQEINAAGCVASQGHAQMYIMGRLLRHGSAAQKQRYLPDIATGRLRLQAFGVTEPSSGSDTTKLKTRAVREGDHYVVTGQKVWTSRALHSDLMLLLARTTPVEQVPRRTDGLSVFLVDLRDSVGRGLEIRPIKAMINHNTTELFFDNLRVPAANLIGEEGKGFRYILDGLNAERILVASEAVGDGTWFIRKATQYAKDRVVFGKPIGQNQGVQFPIARAWAEMEAADMTIPDRADLDQPGAGLRRPACAGIAAVVLNSEGQCERSLVSLRVGHRPVADPRWMKPRRVTAAPHPPLPLAGEVGSRSDPGEGTPASFLLAKQSPARVEDCFIPSVTTVSTTTGEGNFQVGCHPRGATPSPRVRPPAPERCRGAGA